MKTHTHFIGVGGIGMSALARILLQKGEIVSGSDLTLSPLVEKLKKEGAQIFIGHKPENVNGATRVVFSTDVKQSNVEYQEALARGIPMIHRSQLLADVMKGFASLLIAGTHGKTTTTSLLAHVLVHSHLHPAYAVGGIVSSLDTNGAWGRGRYFVAEADESDGSFLEYDPFGAIITNIDRDHLDYWKTDEKLIDGFREFAANVRSKDLLFWCADDDHLKALELGGVSYGFDEKADLYIRNFRQDGWNTYFDLSYGERKFQEIEIPLIGAHNVLNSSAVFGMALKLDIHEKTIRHALSTFIGVGRRAEKKGEVNKISFYDDYAHHPTEIYATLRALKTAISGRRLVVAFQPHRYTRTRDCMQQFPEAFEYADELIVTDIYSAREEPIEGITTDRLLKTIEENSSCSVRYVPYKELSDFFTKFLQPGDLLVTMGAGDVTKIGPEVLKKLS